MRALALPFAPRYIILTLCLALTAVLAATLLLYPATVYEVGIPLAVFGGLALLGVVDLFQTRHAILRNYPISAHLRFIMEDIRPELRQYFFEGEKDGAPFSRDKRAIVYQRAKRALDKRPFGTQYNVYEEGYEWVRHSMAPRPVSAENRLILCGSRRLVIAKMLRMSSSTISTFLPMSTVPAS